MKTPKYKYGDVRIVMTENGYEIQEWSECWFYGGRFKDRWRRAGSAQTLWGLRREWKKLFGKSKPFPEFQMAFSPAS